MMRPRHLPVAISLAAMILTAGCAGIGQQSPSDEVKAFFVAANEANLLGVQCSSTKQLDLSGYAHLMGIKYPPTQSVEVLSSPPSRPYQAFAVLEASVRYPSETYDATLLEDFKNKAKAIGADAIIFCRPTDGAGLPLLQKSSKLGAVAVKYRLEEGQDRTKRP